MWILNWILFKYKKGNRDIYIWGGFGIVNNVFFYYKVFLKKKDVLCIFYKLNY